MRPEILLTNSILEKTDPEKQQRMLKELISWVLKKSYPEKKPHAILQKIRILKCFLQARGSLSVSCIKIALCINMMLRKPIFNVDFKSLFYKDRVFY